MKKVTHAMGVAMSLSLVALCAPSCTSPSEAIGKSQVVNHPFTNDQIEVVVDSVYNTLTLDQRVAQLHSIRPVTLMKDGKLSLELCREMIPYGVGQFAQFACMTDYESEELRDFVRELQAYNKSCTDVPAIFHEEAITGFDALGATVYPQQIGAACAWNPDLIELKSDYTRESMRSIGAQFALSPMVDVIRSQHFNRGEESYGEDGYLSASLGRAFIDGIQGDSIGVTSVAATTKHYLGYGGGADFPEKEVIEEILLPHEVGIRVSGSKSIMPGYHKFKGATSITNKYFMGDILKDYLHYDGMVVSDYGALSDVWHNDNTPRYFHNRVRDAINLGTSIELSAKECINLLPELVESGEVSEERFEEAVKHNLRMKARLGLLEKNPKLFDEGKIDLNKPEYNELAYELAAQSIVLLKNNGVLPLKESASHVALVGPNANSFWALLGDYTYHAMRSFWGRSDVDGLNPKMVTLKEGMERAKYSSTNLSYEKGCDWDDDFKTEIEKGGDTRATLSNLDRLVGMLRRQSDPIDREKAFAISKQSDVVVVAVGENAALCGEARVRKGIRLPGKQEQFVEEMIDLGKPVVLVIFGGRAQVLSQKILDGAAAIVQAWYPGQQGGNAVADILYGKVTPSGKLSTSYPSTESEAPICYNYGAENIKDLVEFPFGYGLSYTTFDFANIKATKKATIGAEEFVVSCDVTNSGAYDGTEVVQLYISPASPTPNYKPIQLKGYERVELKQGETKRVTFRFNPQLLSYFDVNSRMWVTPVEDFVVKIGNSSQDIRLTAPISTVGNEQQVALRDYYFSLSDSE